MMSRLQKKQVTVLRLQEKKYVEIGRILSLSPEAVRGYCKRFGLGIRDCICLRCVCCGKPLDPNRHGQKRIYCSEKCRSALRRLMGELKETTYHHICQNCGIAFDTKGNKNQKYCSMKCYHDSRKRKD